MSDHHITPSLLPYHNNQTLLYGIMHPPSAGATTNTILLVINHPKAEIITNSNPSSCHIFFTLLPLFKQWYETNKFSNNIILLLLPESNTEYSNGNIKSIIDETSLSYWLNKYNEPFSMIRSGIIRESIILNIDILDRFQYIGINYIGDNARVCNMDLITALTKYCDISLSTDVYRNIYLFS